MDIVMKSTDNTPDNRTVINLANSYATLDNVIHATVDIEHEDWEGLTMKEAAKLVEKSPPMIKVLIYGGKVKYKKIKGKYGQEVRINEKSLMSYYDVENSMDNSMDNRVDNSMDNSQANLDNKKSDFIFEKFIAGMEKQIEFLGKEIENKNIEIERLHKLLENQQSLNLQTVHLLNDHNKPTLLQRIFRSKK